MEPRSRDRSPYHSMSIKVKQCFLDGTYAEGAAVASLALVLLIFLAYSCILDLASMILPPATVDFDLAKVIFEPLRLIFVGLSDITTAKCLRDK